jgi:hypothetical protein
MIYSIGHSRSAAEHFVALQGSPSTGELNYSRACVVQLLGAVHGNEEATDQFCRVNAGITSPAEFFAEDNVLRIFAAAQARRTG